MKKERMIFDADPGNLDAAEECLFGHSCPEFVLDGESDKVVLIDKRHNRVDMSIEHFNGFVRGANSGQITEITPLQQMDLRIEIGGRKLAIARQADRIVFTNEQGSRADLSVKHFNRFVGAARSGEITELSVLRRA
jgi:hypothetical protein